MRRFLDWTAAQTTGSNQLSAAPTTNRQGSHHSHHHHHHQHHSPIQQQQQQQQQQPQQQQQSTNPTRDLEIQHLSKLLHEIKYYQASSSPLPSAASSQNQREFVDKIHKTLPLFLNVFGNALPTHSTSSFHIPGGSCQSSVDQLDYSRSESTSSSKPSSPLPLQQPPMDRFPDLLPFAYTIVRLFVSEVRQRASNKHAEDASLAILQFLNNKSFTSKSIPCGSSRNETTSLESQTANQTSQAANESSLSNVTSSPSSLSSSANSVETSQGWNLLLSLNTLVYSQSSQIIQLLCDASLPSTLIKCLYLFFDLPANLQAQPTTSDKDSTNGSAGQQVTGEQLDTSGTTTTLSFAREVTSGPLIKAFTQLLVQLCTHQAAIDELIKKDDLRLLIGIASSQCAPHNRPWRKTAFQTLLAISKNMHDNFMYLEQNFCIQIYVDNMHRLNSLSLASTEEFIDMIKTLLEFLYNLDVNNRNQPQSLAHIIEQFRSSRLSDLIEELLTRIDETILQEYQSMSPPMSDQDIHNYSASQLPSVSSEVGVCLDDFRRYGRRLVLCLTYMAKINLSQETMTNIINIKPLTMSRFEMFEQFKMPRPSAKNCILNYEALRLMKMAWSKCQDSHIIEAILDTTISLFNDDKYNYFVYESQQLLVYFMTSQNFKLFPYKLKQKFFKFLEFIIIETNYIPCLELGTIGTIIKNKASSDADLILGLRTLIACLRFNSKFSDIFREIGILEVIIDLLIQTMQQDKLSQNTSRLEVLFLLLESSQHLLAGPNNMNCTQFNESGAARHVFNCLSKPEFFHLFIPAHSSSSDDSTAPQSNSRITTPSPANLKPQPTIHCQHWLDQSSHLAQNKPSIKQLQKVAFTIIRQLILSTAGDEHLANLLGLLARNLDDLKSYEQLDTSIAETGTEDVHVKSQPKKLDFTFILCQEVNLKICILKSLMIILKDSHRCRTLFRKAGGFIYLVSSLVTLEKSLPSCEQPVEESESSSKWKLVNSRRLWRLIKNTLMTIVVAMRFEPANLRAFSENVIIKFTEAVRRLGCFETNQKSIRALSEMSEKLSIDYFNTYKSIFLAPPVRDFSTISNDNVKPKDACCQLIRFLYDMSLDMGDGTAELEIQLERQGHFHKLQHSCSHDTKSMSFDQGSPMLSVSKESGIFRRRSRLNMAPKRPPSLDLNSTHIDTAKLTFPCIIVAILDLIPSCPSEDLMVFICLVIRSLFKHERNQQLLCEAGMISKLLEVNWRVSLTDKDNFLHQHVEFMLERLTRQAITAKELRTMLRLGNPLKCINLDEIEVTDSYDETRQKLSETKDIKQVSPMEPKKEKLKTDRIESLVAMMSDERCRVEPPFMEFDMSTDGFSSIFMPSIAPINVKSLPPNSSSFLNSTLDVHTNEKNGILGGIGSVERQFPPTAGLTFSTWVCIEKFPARSSDATHNLRLLTIYRGSAATGKEYSCFRIQISALDRALTVSTQESLLFDNENRLDAQQDQDCNLRIWTPELLLEGKWHHIAVTMNRSLVKQSIIHVFVDGVLVHSQRICYISSYVGTTNTGPLGHPTSNNVNCSAAAYVNAFIGSLPQLRFQLRTQWKQGPCHLIEEPLSAAYIDAIFTLGPNSIGNFQNSHKLYDIIKAKGVQLITYDARFQTETEMHHHKPISHQQSVAVVQSNHAHLSRVASSNVGYSSYSTTSSHSNYSLGEDRLMMSIDARATSLMTLSRMRRIYTRFDCRQVSRVLGLALHENSTPILLLHNTSLHMNGSSRGIGAITIGHNHVRCFIPNPAQQALFQLGGSYILLGLVAQAQNVNSFVASLNALVNALKYNSNLQAQMDNINGYQVLSVLYWKKKHLLNSQTLKLTFSLITDTSKNHPEQRSKGIQQVGALRDLVCECFDLWLQTDMIDLVLEFIYELISSSTALTSLEQSGNLSSLSNNTRIKNLKCLRDMDLLPRMLRLLPQYDSQQVDSSALESELGLMLEKTKQSEPSRAFNTKAVYLIKQTVFELLNRTPRQSDILYFGQFVASLLPSDNKERPLETVKLRNILLKSLLQMMTKNNQREINSAMQAELVKILGFDWFMLFILGSYLNIETITIGFLNLMIVLSNEELYISFKNKAYGNGGWLKEPIFPTMDGKFNIQLLGINVGVFFGLGGKRKSIKQEMLAAPNFFLLSNCLTNLIEFPRIYLVIFQTMMGRLTRLDSTVMDEIETFHDLNLDILCDSLVGDTHHKRRQTLSGVQFRCHELIVCLVYMLRDIMWQYDQDKNESASLEHEGISITGVKADSCDMIKRHFNYPTDLIRFLMYLYNNNQEFQQYCRKSDELIDALSASLMQPMDKSGLTKSTKLMTTHPASKEVLELSRLIILDTMTDVSLINESLGTIEHLHALEKFLDSLSACKEAQGELVDMLLRQVLLMIDSTARHNSIATIGNSENVVHFQLLLINSITISQIVTDKIWHKQLYLDNWSRVVAIIDHQLCLAEQIFKFNELLPNHAPPHAFVMQRVLNRIILFALSRPMYNISDNMIMLDLLKKIYDNRTIIILNHMHSTQSAEFFVCLTYCLMKIIEDNSMTINSSPSTQTAQVDSQPSSLIERQYGNPSITSRSSLADPSTNATNSSALMLISLARKVWDAIYQSKKGILSEAFDVSLSLPAFTLETSLDLLQLKPDINDSCQRYWSNFVESESKTKKRLPPRQAESVPGTAATTAVNILSGRLTRVVNAASFVSRVVGATAGMASNVNLVGEKLSQNRTARKDLARSSTDPSGTSNANQNSGTSQVGATATNSSDQNNELFRCPSLQRREIEEAAKIHISIIEDYIDAQLSQKNHKLALHKYLCDEWLDIEDEILLRERAIFGPDYGSQLDKWCLDLTEGPRRMRKKMVNNTMQFYANYPYQPEQYNPTNKSLRYRPPMSYDSYMYYMKTHDMDNHLLELDDKAAVPKSGGAIEEGGSCSIDEAASAEPATRSITPIGSNVDKSAKEESDHPTINVDSPIKLMRDDPSHSSNESLVHSPTRLGQLTAEASSPRPSDGDADDGDTTSFVDFSPEIEAETNSAREAENIDSLSVLRLLEKNERISHMFRCSRVQGLDTYEGLMLFGREHFYLIDGFTLLKTREIKDIDSLPPDAHDPIIPNSTPNIMAHSKKTCAKFSFDSIHEVHKRRYLLQPIALEVFSSDGRNTLIVFPRNIRNKVYSRLMTVSTQLTSNAHESLAGQKSNVSVEGGSGLLSNLIGETSVTQRWVRGELSNFQYLMNLNTIAGRSYNDLMQYPIFPWILADYTSDYLDFNQPSTFRNLSRPVGAQTSDRLEQFKRRYDEWDDGETPPYHYGTFYSSAMIVASYMVRMEPFTQHFLRLQGGHFDLADRMFHSIHDSWMSASKHNMADIKELIPEFFYLPEFLNNENKYDLGIKQNGQKLNDVILPPWAKNDAREFIRLHRCALESDYVSAHLHEWIDLIFGYKQQGQPAVDAVNVFHHLFYEGNVDIYNTDIDPIKKNAVIGFINNFGQVPKQLFKKPHPARKVVSSSMNANAPMPLGPMLPSLSAAQGVNAGQRVLTRCPQSLRQSSATFKDLRGPVGQIVQIDKNIVAVEQNKLLIPSEYCRYIAWGHADRSLRLGLYDSEKPIYVWEGSDNLAPNEILSCTIPNSRTMITAGTESLITVWKIEKMRSFTPIMNLYGHVEPVTCLASSQSYSIIVSGSRDRTAIIWDLNRFTLVRQLGGGPEDKLVHHGPVSAIAINDSTGDIATCASSWLYLWTINGELLAQVETSSVSLQKPMCSPCNVSTNLGQIHILSVCFSQNNEWDLDEVVITGASDGSVAIWSMRYCQRPLSKKEIEEAAVEAKQDMSIGNNQIDSHDSDDNDTESRAAEQLDKSGEVKLDQSLENDTPDREAILGSADEGKDNEDNTKTSSSPSQKSSEPINIRSRQRTSTMNSEWVRLSASSNSTTDTVPPMRTTPSSLKDQTQDTDFVGSVDSFSAESSFLLRDQENQDESRQLMCSTPVSSMDLTQEGDTVKDLSSNKTPNISDRLDDSSTGNLSVNCDDVDGQSMSHANLYLVPNDPSILKFSKSDTSLVDSFVMVGDTTGTMNDPSSNQNNRTAGNRSHDRVRPQSSAGTHANADTSHARRMKLSQHQHIASNAYKLLPNHRWKRELYVRAILPRRNGKNLAAAVTSLAVAKDHRTLFIGDASGRITSWTTT